MRRIAHLSCTLAVAFVSLWPRHCVDAYVSRTVQCRESWIHAVCYAMLAGATLWTYGNTSRPARSRVLAWVGCVLFGALLEVLQEAIPGVNRNGNLKDAMDNALGAFLGIVLPAFFWPKKPKGNGIADELHT